MLVSEPVFFYLSPILAADTKLSQAPSIASMEAIETPTVVSLRPPPINTHKSIGGDEISEKLIVPQKKTRTAERKVVQFSIEDVQIATDSFGLENLIGDGSIGSVYRAHFDSGKVISISSICRLNYFLLQLTFPMLMSVILIV